MPPAALTKLLAMSAVQLPGEEPVTILPMLVLVAALRRPGVSAWLAIGIAWIATALMFGALHLPTYLWHPGQALLVIGAARLVLTGVYLLTRNLWASTLAHVVDDWTLMAIAVGMSRTGIG
ncbi:CPBP family intramembrane metalloprotease [Luteimonas aestuarii]|uniref:CPBP family intramembrane metalloprotease n=1 Tax=Luteimonas aestuarii TaxID=453837 RepID=A0A4R5TPX0_9GAMM|nr:CPBP family intramembrane glutamic endopeptidase [Luteimonas aestuarii]TDK21046.1 CPBP family intramembrane metalloprotease [Luteimonas aestuarii]